MYQMRYEDIMEESVLGAREREIALFDRFVKLLQEAQKVGPSTREAIDVVLYARKLWVVLIEDLGQAENALPKELKASLISIGFFVLREIDRLEAGEMIDFSALIDISKSIRNGLAA